MSDEFVQNTPAGGDTPAPAAAMPATPNVAVQPVANPQAAQSGTASPNPPDGFIPRYRYNEIAQREQHAQAAVKQYQDEMARVKADLDRYRNQVNALVGVTPQQTTEADAIKEQLFKVVPWMKKLEDKFGDLEGLMERGQDMETQVNHYWTTYGNSTMDRLYKLAGESLGGPLTEDGKRQLHSSFVGFLQSSPELANRYASDPTIVEDFWKQFTSSFVEPVRRTASANITQRAAGAINLPQDSRTGIPSPAGAPKLNGLDERAAAAWADFTARTGRT